MKHSKKELHYVNIMRKMMIFLKNNQLNRYH